MIFFWRQIPYYKKIKIIWNRFGCIFTTVVLLYSCIIKVHVMLIYASRQEIKTFSCKVHSFKTKLFCWFVQELDHDSINVFLAFWGFKSSYFIDEIEFRSWLFYSPINIFFAFFWFLIAIRVKEFRIVYLVENFYLRVFLHYLTALVPDTARNLEIMFCFCMGINSRETEKFSSALTNMYAFRYFLFEFFLFEVGLISNCSIKAFLGILHRNSS